MPANRAGGIRLPQPQSVYMQKSFMKSSVSSQQNASAMHCVSHIMQGGNSVMEIRAVMQGMLEVEAGKHSNGYAGWRKALVDSSGFTRIRRV